MPKRNIPEYWLWCGRKSSAARSGGIFFLAFFAWVSRQRENLLHFPNFQHPCLWGKCVSSEKWLEDSWSWEKMLQLCSSLLRKEGQDEWGNGSIAVTWNRKRQRDLHLFNSRLQFPQSRSIAFMILLWWKNFSEARLCQERRIRNAKRFSMEISFSRYAPKIFIYGERRFTYFHIYECSPATCSSVKPYSDCAWDEKKERKKDK